MGCFIFGGGGIGGNGGVPFDQVTMEPQFGLAGKKFIDKNKQLRTGTIQNWDGTPISLSEGDTPVDPDTINPSLTSKYIPAGVYLGKPVYFPKMPEGSVSGAQMDDSTFRVTKTAGYINAGTQDFSITGGSPTAYALDHIYATNNTTFHIVPMDSDMPDSQAYRMFVAVLFAHGSVSNGEFAAFTLGHDDIGGWILSAYVPGWNPPVQFMGTNYFQLDYYVRPESSPYPGYWVLTLGKDAGLFSTNKYYEGFAYYI